MTALLRIILTLSFSVLLTACATSSRTTIYVASEVTAADAETLASDIVKHLAVQLAPAKTTLVLDAPESNNTKKEQADLLTPVLLEKLQSRGYGVAVIDQENLTANQTGITLRYLISPLENGLVVRLQYAQKEATRFYPRNTTGVLVPGGSFTVRDGGAK